MFACLCSYLQPLARERKAKHFGRVLHAAACQGPEGVEPIQTGVLSFNVGMRVLRIKSSTLSGRCDDPAVISASAKVSWTYVGDILSSLRGGGAHPFYHDFNQFSSIKSGTLSGRC